LYQYYRWVPQVFMHGDGAPGAAMDKGRAGEEDQAGDKVTASDDSTS